MYLISSCLIGLNCKYNGKSNTHEDFTTLIKEKRAIPFCPEQAGGLSTPRRPAEIKCGDGFDVIKGETVVVTIDGIDVTDYFLTGAKETLKLAVLIGADKAILKSRSPSCGCKTIYDGSFKNIIKQGMGVTAAYLKLHGIQLIDSEDCFELGMGGCY
jgi:uncharacterized protein YbbK (DUF523 family)